MQVQSEACMQCKVVMLGSASTGKTSIIHRQVNNTFSHDVKPTLGAGLSYTIIKVDPNNISNSTTSLHPVSVSSSLADLSTNSTILPNSSLNKNSNKANNNKIDVKLNIWDTAGQESYRSLARIYYRDSQAAIIVFDITNKSSFDDVDFWINELRSLLDKCSIFIVGNKLDLVEPPSDTDNTPNVNENKDLNNQNDDPKDDVNDQDEENKTYERQVSYQQGHDYASKNNAIYFETSAKTGKGVADLFEAVANRFVITKRDPNILKRSMSATAFATSSKKGKRNKIDSDDDDDDNSSNSRGVINVVDTNNDVENSEKNGNRSNCCT